MQQGQGADKMDGTRDVCLMNTQFLQGHVYIIYESFKICKASHKHNVRLWNNYRTIHSNRAINIDMRI